MQKLVRLEEVRDYIANGWRVVVIASAPPPDYRPGWCLVEAR
jgi:hypothetical protein